jgi:hypothetical protein
MLSLILSTLTYFVASVFLKGYFEYIGIPRSMARGLMVFVLALSLAYGVAYFVDLVAP